MRSPYYVLPLRELFNTVETFGRGTLAYLDHNEVELEVEDCVVNFPEILLIKRL
jgi:hypothetical protein